MTRQFASLLTIAAAWSLCPACSAGGADTGQTQSDQMPPSVGVVYDGPGADIDHQSFTNTINANWTGFADAGSGIRSYQWSIGTAKGLADVQPWIDVGKASGGSNAALSLTKGKTYFVSVRAVDNAANVSDPAHSNGVRIDDVDLTGPTPGTVSDGTGADISQQNSTAVISANWAGFADTDSGIASYEWAIGTTPGGTNVQGWASAGNVTSATKPGLSLSVGNTYYVSVRGIDNAHNVGSAASSDGVEIVSGTPGLAISQFGITWTFADTYPMGQFANGDWWVVGPADIIGINPPSVTSGGRTMHGSMIDPAVTSVEQAYDSAMYSSYAPEAYNASLNVGLNISRARPLVLQPGRSLVSSISSAQAGVLPQLTTAAVLTCVATAPAAGSFRPPYAKNAGKTVRFNKSQLRYSLLAKLAPVASTPTLASVERSFERPWLDHAPGWLARYMHPVDNLPDYGRDISSAMSVGALTLQLNYTDQQKEKLLTRFVQLGIDNYGIVTAGGLHNWEPDGGQASGRKWPILFAGVMLNDAAMSQIGQNSSVLFGEDGQTFVVQQTSPGVYNGGFGGYVAADVGTPEWGIRHQTEPNLDAKGWEANSYRTCCTANAWSGFVLAARIMGQRTAWNHPALFDYLDRYLQVEQIPWRRFWDPGFTAEMWQTYRPSY